MQLVRLAKPLYFFFRLARDPNELDRVFQMEASGDPRLMQAVCDRLSEEPEAREALATRPRLGPLTMVELLAMPEGSLGREYGRFMMRHGLSPDAIPRVADATGPGFVRGHLHETHDLWHVLTGFAPDPAGEAGLQAVYAAQLPGILNGALIAALLLNGAIELSSRKTKERLDAVARGWELGTRAKLLFGYRWRDNLERALDDVRRELGVDASLATPRALRNVLDYNRAG